MKKSISILAAAFALTAGLALPPLAHAQSVTAEERVEFAPQMSAMLSSLTGVLQSLEAQNTSDVAWFAGASNTLGNVGASLMTLETQISLGDTSSASATLASASNTVSALSSRLAATQTRETTEAALLGQLSTGVSSVFNSYFTLQ